MAAANSFEKRCRDPAPVRRDGLAFEQDLPFIGQEESGNQRNQSRLVGSRAAYDADKLVVIDPSIEVTENGQPGSNQGLIQHPEARDFGCPFW